MSEPPPAQEGRASEGLPPPGQPATQGRGAYVLSQLYYYLAAAVAVGVLISGGVTGLIGVRILAWPKAFETRRYGGHQILHGLALVIPAALVLWWHVKEVRRREGKPYPPTFWGRSLYYHLVALVALAFVLAGSVRVLSALAEIALPSANPGPSVQIGPPIPIPPEQPGVQVGPGIGVFGPTVPSRAEAGRTAIDGLVVLLVAGGVLVFHLREGRRATAPL